MAKKRTLKVWVNPAAISSQFKNMGCAWVSLRRDGMKGRLRATLTIESPAPKPQRRGK